MNYTKYILVAFCFFILGCSNTKQESKVSVEVEHLIEVYSLPNIPDSIRNNQLGKSIFLTDLYQKDVSHLLAPCFSVLELTDSRMLIATESKFVYHLLGHNESVDGLQSKYDSIFEVEKIEIDYPHHKLTHKDSFLKTIHSKYEGWECDEYVKIDDDFIICAVIENEEIHLAESIKIGISKEELFYKIFSLKIPLSIDTLKISDIMGDSQVEYIFDKNRLEKVRITSNSDLVDFDF